MAQDDCEVVEILHCLLLLMCKVPSETIPEFFAHLSKSGFEAIRKSEELKMAEGVAMYCALLVSGITDCCNGVFPEDYTKIVNEFVTKHFHMLTDNPYNLVPVFASYGIFHKEGEFTSLTRKMKTMAKSPETALANMIQLLEYYGLNKSKDVCYSIISHYIFI